GEDGRKISENAEGLRGLDFAQRDGQPVRAAHTADFSRRLNMRLALVLGVAAVTWAQPRSFTVAADGTGDFASVQAAVDAASAPGAVIRIKPGVYRQVLNIAKSGIQLRGMGAQPADVVLTFDNSAGTAGGTTRSASVTVSGDDFYAENL